MTSLKVSTGHIRQVGFVCKKAFAQALGSRTWARLGARDSVAHPGHEGLQGWWPFDRLQVHGKPDGGILVNTRHEDTFSENDILETFLERPLDQLVARTSGLRMRCQPRREEKGPMASCQLLLRKPQERAGGHCRGGDV